MLGPGPSNAHPTVLQALSRMPIGHLDPLYVALMGEVQELLRYVWQTDNRLTLPMSGTGSAAMEATIANMVEPGDSVLVAVAISDELWVIYTGVFLGILALRMLACFVVSLLDRYPRFKHLAYLVVGLAGAKLAVAGWDKFAKEVLHRPELALGLDKEAFSLFILAVLLLGSLWATRKPAPA